jgi:hypothetical protein
MIVVIIRVGVGIMMKDTVRSKELGLKARVGFRSGGPRKVGCLVCIKPRLYRRMTLLRFRRVRVKVRVRVFYFLFYIFSGNYVTILYIRKHLCISY